ncbi:class I SAM-dependent methyltransferase [Ramlibacter sp. PS4R-6]|uniref:class I SAM-dependent methyltransferase n=1 Tax=Ramlibacter sp. PS4R-6 TaxID=3133438 RepID=UPI0030AD4395
MSAQDVRYVYGEYAYSDVQSAQAHSYLLPALLKALEGAGPGPILDLGCGNGSIAHRLLALGFDVHGVDASASGVELARKQGSPERFHVMDLGRDDLPAAIAGKRFATVISTEVIEHLYDPRAMLRLAMRLLDHQPGSRLIVSTPYHGYLKNLAIALCGKMDKHLTVLWDGGHIKFFSRRTLEQMLQEEGFRPVGFQGAGRWPYLWKSMVITAEVA